MRPPRQEAAADVEAMAVHRRPLLQLLESYRVRWRDFDPLREETVTARFVDFVRGTVACFERSHPPGHVTGSALVYCPETGRVLLTLHRKLGKWLQLGGHADGVPEVARVALTEAREESGLRRLTWWPGPGPEPFDLDIHEIPARAQDPPHLHYDVRFLALGHSGEPVELSKESRELGWFTLPEASRLTRETSMLRQFAKLERLAAQVGPDRLLEQLKLALQVGP